MAAVEPPTSGPYTVTNILGPTILGSFGAGILQGLLLCKAWVYFSESKDGRILKGLVFFVNFIALQVVHYHRRMYYMLSFVSRFQTSLLGGHLWYLMVEVRLRLD